MATIAIFVDAEEGHVLSTFWLSRYLKARGHVVCYLSHADADVERMIRNQGFEFTAISDNSTLTSIQHGKYLGPLVRGELLDSTIAKLRPDVALVLSEYCLAGLAIRYRYQLPIIYFTPMLRRYARIHEFEIVIRELLEVKSGVAEFLELLTKAGERFKSFRDVARLVLNIPEIILLPEAFDLPGRDKDPKSYYVGAGIDLMRSEELFPWDCIDSSRPLVYCARGSQLQIDKEANRRLLQISIDAAATRHEWQFIIAISKIFKAEDFFNIPPNAKLFNWAPQLEVLSRSNVMVNHGGFGTIKECVHMGAPMVVLPLKGRRDHSDCAQRVAYHGLGVQNDDPNISPGELILLIDQVLNDTSFRYRVDQMREMFKRQDRLELAAQVIENVIAGHTEIALHNT